jgi:capsular polysaccharide transport system ATP-binding protein
MIHFINAEKYFDSDVGPMRILRPTSMTIPTHLRVGLLGRNGAGKSTLLRMIAGVEKPNSGNVIRKGKISWPLGLTGGLHNELTGIENVQFLVRLYDADFREVLDFVDEFSELGAYLDMPVRLYSSGMRAKLMFGLSLAIDFDCYLIDELVGVGDRFFREKSKKAFADRALRSGLLFVSHNEKTVKEYCDYALVLYNGFLVPFDNVDDGIDFYLRCSES